MQKKKYDRESQDLLADYADALRDGSMPRFLKSLTAREAKSLVSGSELGQAMETVQVLNQAAFADKAVMPEMSLFISRVDAKIASRARGGRSPSLVRHAGSAQPADRTSGSGDRL